MKKVSGKKPLLLYASFLISTSGFASNSDLVPARLIDSSSPKHPYETYTTREADSGAAEVVFMVDETGVPEHLAVVRSSQTLFDKQALIAVSKYRYEPALYKGKAVKSAQRAYVIFDHSRITNRSGFPGPMEIPNGFGSYFNKISNWLSKPNPDERKIRHTLRKMQDLAYQTFMTEKNTELAKLRIEETFGEHEAQIEPIKRLLMFSNVEWNKKRVIDDELLRTARMGLLSKYLELKQFAEFQRSYREFSRHDSEIKATFESAYEEVEQIRLSDTVIERSVKVSEREYTFLPLFKSSFSIEVISGELNEFALRCSAKYREFKFQLDATYMIPPSWGECEMQINGNAGSLVSVLQQ